jgi:hypothetical protein
MFAADDSDVCRLFVACSICRLSSSYCRCPHGQCWPCGSGPGPARLSMDTSDSGSSTPSGPQPEFVLALAIPRSCSLQAWAATRRASMTLRDTVGPPPMCLMLRLAAAGASSLQGELHVEDVGPLPLQCRRCGRQPNRDCLQRMLRVCHLNCVLGSNARFAQGQRVYIGAVCCATPVATLLREEDWEKLKHHVTTDIGSHPVRGGPWLSLVRGVCQDLVEPGPAPPALPILLAQP